MHFKIMKSAFFKLSLAALSAMALTSAASALSFNLSVPNSGISAYTGPYATVNLSLNGAKDVATITFTGLSSGNYSFGFGGGGSGAVGVNANGSSTVDTISFTAAFAAAGPLTNGGSGNQSEFGTFSNTINAFDGFTNAVTSVSFHLNKSSGSWANEGDVLAANASGAFAAAHIFVWDHTIAQPSSGAAATGFASNGGASVADGGSTIALLGGALMLLGGIYRRGFSIA